MRHTARLIVVLLIALGLIATSATGASAATYRNWIAQQPTTPAAGQSVVVWVD